MKISRPRRLARPFVAFGVLCLSVTPALGAQQITVRAGDGTLGAVAPRTTATIPISVDMSAAAGLDVAELVYTVRWSAAGVEYVGSAPGTFGTATIDESQVANRELTVSITSPTGATSSFDASSLDLRMPNEEAVVTVEVTVSEARDQMQQDILPQVKTEKLELCVGQEGLWGDVTADGAVNIIDGQQVARASVGLPVTNPVRIQNYGDVTDDGQVNIIDAQQIARFSVGLSSTPRTGQPRAQCTAPSAGLVFHLSFDEGSGQVAADQAGSNDGELGSTSGADVNDPDWLAAGRVDGAMVFDYDGSQPIGATRTEYVLVANDPALEPAQISVQIWARAVGSLGAFSYPLAKGGAGCQHASYAFYSNVSGGLSFYVTNGANTVQTPDLGPGLWDGQWHHFVGTYDEQYVRLYVDGVEVGNGTANTDAIVYNLSTVNDLHIGSYRGTCQLGFRGDIDDVKIWNRALTAAEVAQAASIP